MDLGALQLNSSNVIDTVLKLADAYPCWKNRSDFSGKSRFPVNSFVREPVIGSVKPRLTAGFFSMAFVG